MSARAARLRRRTILLAATTRDRIVRVLGNSQVPWYADALTVAVDPSRLSRAETADLLRVIMRAIDRGDGLGLWRLAGALPARPRQRTLVLAATTCDRIVRLLTDAPPPWYADALTVAVDAHRLSRTEAAGLLRELAHVIEHIPAPLGRWRLDGAPRRHEGVAHLDDYRAQSEEPGR